MAKHGQPDESWTEWVLKSLPIQMEASMAEPAAAGLEPGPRDPEPFSVPMSLVPSYDVIERLPPGAADRLRALRQRFNDLNVLIPKHDVMHEASTARIMAEQRLRRLIDHPHDNGFGLKPDDGRVVEQKKLVARLNDELKRLTELSETRSQVWTASSHVLTAVESWLKNGKPPGVVLQDYDGPEPKLLKNEGLLDAILRLQRRGRELKADLHRIRSAPYPSAHARAAIRQEVEALATQGAPSVSDVVEHDRKIIWPMQSLRSTVYNTEVSSFAATEVVDVLSLFAFVHKDALLASLDALVSEEADDAASLSHEAR